MTKKVYKQKCFSVTNKNLNGEIITKNLVTFKFLKNEMKLRIKNFNIIGVHWKIWFRIAWEGGEGEGALKTSWFMRGLAKKREGWCFWGYAGTQCTYIYIYMVIMVTTNFTFSKIFRLLPFSLATIIITYVHYFTLVTNL